MTRLLLITVALLCQAVALIGAFYALFGWETVQTGANVSAWLTDVLLTVVLPMAVCLVCVAMLVRPSRRLGR
jgi:hypothetical protein